MRLIFIAVLILLTGCAGQTRPDADARAEARQQYDKALAEMKKGDPIAALPLARRAATLDPSNARAQELLALLYQQNGQGALAAAAFEKALALNPTSASLLNNHANFQCHQKRYAQAFESFDRAANLPGNAHPEIALTNAGLCALRSGDRAVARNYFQQAIELRADQPVALYQMARLSLEEGNPVAANSWLEQFLNHYPHTAKTLLLGARIEHRLGNPLGVADYVDKLRSGFPSASETAQAAQLMKSAGGALPVASGGSVFGRDWVSARDPEHFTVQIASAPDRQRLEALAAKLQTSENAIFSINAGGATRYILVSGDYASFDDARNALIQARKTFPGSRPWIRNFASIHNFLPR